MNGGITYRKAVSADIDTVTDLLCKLYDMAQDELLAENSGHFTDARMAFFLAFDGGEPVGISHGSLRREYVNGANDGVKGYLEAIYVLPEYRLRGIAAELVKSVERWAAKNGCREFASDCLLDNAESYKFHIKIGFAETERNIFFLKSIEPLAYKIYEVDSALREKIQPILNKSWGAPELAVNGKLWDSRTMPGFAAIGDDGEVFGYLLYEFHNDAHQCVMEIMVLESVIQNIGAASALIEEVKKIAKRHGVGRIIVQTSNDNIHAIRFYQRRGFTIRAVRFGAMDAARQLKPSIPLVGDDGIPLRDEIEFVIEIL